MMEDWELEADERIYHSTDWEINNDFDALGRLYVSGNSPFVEVEGVSIYRINEITRVGECPRGEIDLHGGI